MTEYAVYYIEKNKKQSFSKRKEERLSRNQKRNKLENWNRKENKKRRKEKRWEKLWVLENLKIRLIQRKAFNNYEKTMIL